MVTTGLRLPIISPITDLGVLLSILRISQRQVSFCYSFSHQHNDDLQSAVAVLRTVLHYQLFLKKSTFGSGRPCHVGFVFERYGPRQPALCSLQSGLQVQIYWNPTNNFEG